MPDGQRALGLFESTASVANWGFRRYVGPVYAACCAPIVLCIGYWSACLSDAASVRGRVGAYPLYNGAATLKGFEGTPRHAWFLHYFENNDNCNVLNAYIYIYISSARCAGCTYYATHGTLEVLD